MKIAVLVKYVPDTSAERRFDAADNTLDRSGPGLLSELDEYAVEQAVRVAEVAAGELVAVTVGPEAAVAAVTKALQIGADRGVHVVDDAVAGSDAPATARVLAAALDRIGELDLIVTGMGSTDAGMNVVSAMLAELLGLPLLGSVVEYAIDSGRMTARRDLDTATETLVASLPLVVSVTDQSAEPRYPSFKSIMAAKKKPIECLSLADLGLDPATAGQRAAWTSVSAVRSNPPRERGEIVVDNGDAAELLTKYLISNGIA